MRRCSLLITTEGRLVCCLHKQKQPTATKGCDGLKSSIKTGRNKRLGWVFFTREVTQACTVPAVSGYGRTNRMSIGLQSTSPLLIARSQDFDGRNFDCLFLLLTNTGFDISDQVEQLL